MIKENIINNRKNITLQMEYGLLVVFSGEAPVCLGDQLYPFSVNRNFYYLTGITAERSILVIMKTKDTVKEMLFIERFDLEVSKWNGAVISDNKAREISGIEAIDYCDTFYNSIANIIYRNLIKTIYIDMEKRFWDSDLTLALKFKEEITKRYPAISMTDAYPLLAKLREIKHDYEIDEIKKAIDATKNGIYMVMDNAKAGISELALQGYFELGTKLKGAQKNAFKPIIAGGKNGAILHYENSSEVIFDNELVLIDVGAEYNNYCADITRTIPINGKFTKRQKQIYSIVLEGQQRVFDIIKEGTPYKELNKTLKDFYTIKLKEIGLIKEDAELDKYYFHGVSHFLGLETHDISISQNDTLKAGMVLTVEPGLYLIEEGLGIRIEDDVLVTKTGYINLSESIIKTVDEIEQYMNKTLSTSNNNFNYSELN